MTDLIHSLIYWFTQQMLTKHGHVSVLGRGQDPRVHQIDGHLPSRLSV